MTRKILLSLLLMTAVSLAAPPYVNAQYGQVLASETPEEVSIVHEVKAAGVGDFVNPGALGGGFLVVSGMYLYIDRKRRVILKDFDFVR